MLLFGIALVLWQLLRAEYFICANEFLLIGVQNQTVWGLKIQILN